MVDLELTSILHVQGDLHLKGAPAQACELEGRLLDLDHRITEGFVELKNHLLNQSLFFRPVKANGCSPLMNPGAPRGRLFNASIVLPLGRALGGLVIREAAVEVAHLHGLLRGGATWCLFVKLQTFP